MTGSDIKNFVNLAYTSAHKHKRRATNEDFDFAADRINIGVVNKSLKLTYQDKYMTAVHEGGHALLSLLNPQATPMNKVTILSKGGSLGHTSFLP